MTDTAAWTGVVVLLSVAWAGLLYFASNERSRYSQSLFRAKTAEKSNIYLMPLRPLVPVFLISVIITVFMDLEAWALTRFTVWSLFLSTLYYLSVSWRFDEIYFRPNVVVLCLAAELVVCVVYWSLYEKTFKDQTTREQFHTLGAHAIVQILLVLEFVSMRGQNFKLERKRIWLALSGYMVAYGTAIYAFSYATDSPLPYSVIDPDETHAAVAVVAGAWAAAVAVAGALAWIHGFEVKQSIQTRVATTVTGELIF